MIENAIDLSRHGKIWKQLFCELYTQHLIESFQSHLDYDSIASFVSHAKDNIFFLKIDQLPSHLPLEALLKAMGNLTELKVQYNVKFNLFFSFFIFL